MDYNEAMKSLQYEESRRELTEAEEYLDKKYRSNRLILRPWENKKY